MTGGTSGTGIGTSLTGSASAGGLPNTFNYNPGTNLVKWRTALGRVATKQGNAHALFIGDSTTYGSWGVPGNLDTGDLAAYSFTARLRDMFARSGIPATEDSFAGTGFNAENRLSTDFRIVNSGGWFNGGPTLGGDWFESGSAGNLAFTPRQNCDTFKIWYIKVGSAGSFTIDINGAGTQTINASGSTSVTTTTIATTLGANTLNLNWSSGGHVYITGIESWNSQASQIILQNSGWPTVTSSQFTSGLPYDPIPIISNYIGDLIVLTIGINDWNSGVSASAFSANMQVIINACIAVSDVVLCTPVPSSTNQNFAVPIIQATYNLAKINNLPLIDNYARFSAYASDSALYANTVHPNNLGYADFARGMYTLLSAP